MSEHRQSPQRTSFSEWHKRTGSYLVALRSQRGLSAQQVADRTCELGVEVTRSSIANLESGRKTSLSVVELAVLAAALEVAPVRLLFDVEDEPVEVLPGNLVAGVEAADWFSGLATRPGSTRSDNLAGPLALYRRHKEISSKFTDLMSNKATPLNKKSDLAKAWATALLATRSEMTACKVTPPPLDTETQHWLDYVKADA
ncbi:helix-turn-helix domain-containing protein [Demequina sp. B12]|uniref:helix-turn-helix domain-containing protein n=1 Tax=Demequina sp. B12 TaxID=2992757 RepID=UPI00237BCDEA|nr:helix-turn-helix transcriptional regulator [Demequina sp. B12]MDE0571815.1 helix-turn-helix domain-containing protein [Demequina sp. B12]